MDNFRVLSFTAEMLLPAVSMQICCSLFYAAFGQAAGKIIIVLTCQVVFSPTAVEHGYIRYFVEYLEKASSTDHTDDTDAGAT